MLIDISLRMKVLTYIIIFASLMLQSEIALSQKKYYVTLVDTALQPDIIYDMQINNVNILKIVMDPIVLTYRLQPNDTQYETVINHPYVYKVIEKPMGPAKHAFDSLINKIELSEEMVRRMKERYYENAQSYYYDLVLHDDISTGMVTQLLDSLANPSLSINPHTPSYMIIQIYTDRPDTVLNGLRKKPFVTYARMYID